MPTPVIFLHGASSSGKSTLARAIQSVAPVPFWHLSIDHLRDSGAWPMTRFQNGSFDWSAYRALFFDGFQHMIGAVAATGNPVILEHILDEPDRLPALRAVLKNCDVLFVALHCPLSVLQRREAERGDRQPGSAERDFQIIHNGLSYDLHLSSEDPATVNADLVLQALGQGTRSSSFSAT